MELRNKMLEDVPVIDQVTYMNVCRAAMRHPEGGSNVLVFGPSGGGKTFIAKEAAELEGCRLIYINLSVLERTDFQGFPVVSDNKQLVSYATPEFLPFVDTSDRDERQALQNYLDFIQETPKNRAEINTLTAWANKRVKELDKKASDKAVANLGRWVSNSDDNRLITNFKKIAEQLKLEEDSTPNLILFDEADKAITETTQTLLELLQFNSVNGRKLNIRATVLTANLPDEHAHVNQLSHAITKRCQTYKLELDFQQWVDWARRNKVDNRIIQFLATKPNLLYQTAGDDPTSYALPSPRTWAEAAGRAFVFDDENKYKDLNLINNQTFEDMSQTIISGYVGCKAAIEFGNWNKFYKHLDPKAVELLEKGVHPKLDDSSTQEILICAISAASRAFSEMKPNNEKKLEKYITNAFGWIKNLPEDIQMGACRMSFGGQFENVHKYKLHNIDNFWSVFQMIDNKLNDY